MVDSDLQPARLAAPPERDHERRVLSARPGAYLAIVATVALAAMAYNLRHDGIFACQASGYDAERYLAYCQATQYGDYDHGAFWFGLEPAARQAATEAQVVFLGNSRLEFGLSTKATADWFSSAGISYYLLGFSYNGNYRFEAPLLRKLGPRARFYVINVDLFFRDAETPPTVTVLHDPGAEGRHEQKRLWQPVHRALCTTLPALCRDEVAYFRSRTTGAWVVTGGQFRSGPVSYGDSVDVEVVAGYTAAGKEFLAGLPVARDCAILTYVPTVDSTAYSTGAGTARAVAASLGLPLVSPELEGLNTFDRSHLDRPSAERWSAAFMAAAGPQILRCLAAPPDSVTRGSR